MDPLQAALIVEFAAKLHGDSAPKKFSYRGVQPLFEGGEFSINANETQRRHGTVDRERRGPADHEGHGELVRPHRPRSLLLAQSAPGARAA